MSILGSSNLNELTIEKIDERKKFLTNQLSSLNMNQLLFYYIFTFDKSL